MNRYLLLMMLLSGLALQAQTKKEEQYLLANADADFLNEQYHSAIDKYLELIDKNINHVQICYRLAESYRKTFYYQQAEAYYLKAYDLSPDKFPLSLYYYGLMLKLNGNYDESIKYIDRFMSSYKEADSLKEYLEQAFIEKTGCEMAKSEWPGMESIRKSYRPLPEPVNSPYNDFAPAPLDSSTLIVTSSRLTSKFQLIEERYGEGYTDNYYYQKKDAWRDVTHSLFNINSSYNDGSGAFNKRGNKYYFTICGLETSACNIFVTTLKDGKWSEPQRLNSNINAEGFESKQPAISHGGDTLFFVSNRSGGFGMFDIWMSVDSGEDLWGPAMNPGKMINTKYNELSPAVTPFGNIIFFASDGHQGFGGLDIFMAKKISNGDTVLTNVGFPVNSHRDDGFLTVTEKKIYWASNRMGGVGGFDIYTSNIISAISFISKVSLRSGNDSRNSRLKQRSEKIESLELIASTHDERIDYHQLSYEKKQIVDKMARRMMHREQNSSIDFSGLSDEEFRIFNALAVDLFNQYLVKRRLERTFMADVNSPADSTANNVITGIILDSLKNLPLSGIKILLTDETGEIIKVTSTNETGAFRFSDVPSSRRLIIRLADAPDDAIVPMLEDMSIEGISKQYTFYVENIFFDFAHYTIRHEASLLLDEIAEFLLSNPGVQIELFAFADDRGTDEYNFYLTQRRGQAVGEYLMKKGVDETSLAIIAKGKQFNASAGEIARQYNRRVELYFTGLAHPFIPRIKTYILKKTLDWRMLAKETGVEEQELKAINGIQGDWIKAYKPIGIPAKANNLSKNLFFSGI